MQPKDEMAVLSGAALLARVLSLILKGPARLTFAGSTEAHRCKDVQVNQLQ